MKLRAGRTVEDLIMSLPSGSKERSSRPYEKSVKCVVVAVGTPTEYASKDGELKKMMTAACSDSSAVYKMLCYDSNKFKFLKVGHTLVLRNVISRVEESIPVLVLTTNTKIFMSSPLDNCPDDHKQQGQLIVNPPKAAQVLIQEALSSPTKKRNSISGKIIQEEEPKTVNVRGEEVHIKTLTLQDSSGKAKVTLWRELSSADVRPGDYVQVSDVIVNIYNKSTTLSTTNRSKIEKCEAPEERKTIEIEGLFVDGDKTELLLSDESTVTVDTEMMQRCLSTDTDLMPDLEMATSAGTLKADIILKGSEVMTVELKKLE